MGYLWDNDSDNGDKTGHRTNYCPIWVCLKLGYSLAPKGNVVINHHIWADSFFRTYSV